MTCKESKKRKNNIIFHLRFWKKIQSKSESFSKKIIFQDYRGIIDCTVVILCVKKKKNNIIR